MSAKKSDRLLSKLNRSLGGEPDQETPAAATPAPATAPARKRKARSAPAPSTAPTPSAAPTPKSAAASAPVTVPVVPPATDAPATAPRRHAAEKIVLQHVPFAVGAGLIPVPLADLAAIGGLQLKVLRELSRLYDVPFTKSQAEHIVTSLLGSMGGTVLASSLLGSMVKLVPGIGTLLSVSSLPAASGAITYAIGQLAVDHFERGGTLENFDLDVAQQALARKLNEAKAKLPVRS